MAEVETVVHGYRKFLGGAGDPAHIVPAERIEDRLDVKHCLIDRDWRHSGNLPPLSDFVEPKAFMGDDVIECQLHEEHEQLFTVRYDGTAAAGRIIFPRTETEYPQLFRVRGGELVISNIAATYGSVAVVPPHLGGLVVSKEYTVLKVSQDTMRGWYGRFSAHPKSERSCYYGRLEPTERAFSGRTSARSPFHIPTNRQSPCLWGISRRRRPQDLKR